MHPGRYRIRLFFDLCRTIIFPVIALSTVLALCGRRLGILAIPTHITFIIICTAIRVYVSQLIQDREAAKLGAKPIPRVVGKWPGNIDVLLKMLRAFKTNNTFDVYLQLFEEYQSTTLNTRFLWTDSIITMDYEHMKFFLTDGFDQFWRGVRQKERLELFLGQGIFNRDGAIWKMHRAIARPFFARDRISDFAIFEKHCSQTIAMLSAAESAGLPSEAQDLYARFVIDAASEFLFGKNLETLSGDLPIPGKTPMGPKGSATRDEWGSFTVAFEMAQQVATSRVRIGYLWPLFELFGDTAEPHVKVIRQWLDPLVKRALYNKAASHKAGTHMDIKEKTFLEHLADSTDDPVLIRDQLLSMLLAARDTTAATLTFITYFMAMHPEVVERLRAEVLEHCGPDAPPTPEQIKHMKYLRAVIDETLRIFPAVPLNSRESRDTPCLLPPSDSTYPDEDRRPLYMPGAAPVLYHVLLVQQNKAIWGPDAEVFDPDRWLQPERMTRYAANPSIFSPFSIGPRLCVGKNYAYNEVSYFLVRLLQQFDRFTLAPEFQPEGSLPPPHWKQGKGRPAVDKIWPGIAMTLYVKGGLWVRFHKASS